MIPNFISLPANIPSDFLQVGNAFTGLTTAIQQWIAQVSAAINNNVLPTLRLTPVAPPAAPTTGFAIYVDASDGNKLKAKYSDGTVYILVTPV